MKEDLQTKSTSTNDHSIFCFSSFNNFGQGRTDLLKSLQQEPSQIMQLHTQACLEYVTSLQVATGKSTMGSDYVEHKTAYLYQPLPISANTNSVKTPFAKQISE
jgi:hypothetical protein